MKKIMAVFAVLMLLAASSVFAGGSTNAKDKEYGACQRKVPDTCGGAQNVNWNDPVARQKWIECTTPKYQECYRIYTQGK